MTPRPVAYYHRDSPAREEPQKLPVILSPEQVRSVSKTLRRHLPCLHGNLGASTVPPAGFRGGGCQPHPQPLARYRSMQQTELGNQRGVTGEGPDANQQP
jgi:hypothetical protein